VCLGAVAGGRCAEHGPWGRHQCVTGRDRRHTARTRWEGFEPEPHACPRCLGPVAPVRDGFACVEHAHDLDPHGPFRVDELLGPTAQRESARRRLRAAHAARRTRQTRPAAPAVALALPELGRASRVAGGATIMAATLAYLLH
jgi:hypothetical protein